ncbi:type IV secretion system protein [Rahnella perminowiae]|uniref:type IV secretion system protein n=1 Tax=Rahnella perminowiae TaxID=2816244 RepID=UPI00215D2DD5|nr:type IV secretion system protein [Rahnella perminowiae]MCR8998685.1 type IV secretion system protein [Rahnella perminowiae]MCR8998743.1 type IV secretion system protein [Rahnella perminowiae]
MFSKKIKKENDKERQLHYGDGPLEGKDREVNLLVKAYTDMARLFEKRFVDDLLGKVRFWRRSSFLGWSMVLVAIIALMGLTPLKTVVPFILQTDSSSGAANVIKPTFADGDSLGVKQDKHFIMAWVLAHESYNWATQPANYAFIQLTSSDSVFASYKNFQLSKKGFVATLGQNQQVHTDIDWITPMTSSKEPKLTQGKDSRTYQVSFRQTLLMADNQPVPESKPLNWVGIITLNNENPPKTEGDEWSNPAGYLVLDWQPTQTSGKGDGE